MSNAIQAEMLAKNLAEDEEDVDQGEQYSEFLGYAREAHRSSYDYMQASLKKQWEKNMSHFQSRHAPGSKYYSEAYKFRSKFFRAKTRSMIRRNEAAAAMAYFATGDAVNIEPEDEDNPMQAMSADINKEILNYRLDKSIPWFQICIGAYQEAMNIGIVVSYQYWRYKEVTTERVVQSENEYGALNVDENGYQNETVKETRIVKDEPVIELRPPENLLIDEAADWDDPIGTSPFLIDVMSMYVYEVLNRMAMDEDHEDKWFTYTEAKILSASRDDYDSLRREREGRDRRDSKDDDNIGVNDFRTVWVHRNFIRKGDEEYVYYTLGTQFMLSKPVTIQEKYQQDYRPYVMGACNIETHRVHPSSASQLGEQTQNEINDIANTRMDNIRLALNKRTYVRRGANVDYRALMRSAPGAGILMDDINTDVKQETITDVTGSSYQEQDRLSNDYDEVTGTFSTGSVQSNKSLNETVGGMEMLSNDSNIMSEYQLRVFNETWVEPVLRQLLDLIKRYESDETVIAIAGRRAGVDKKYGRNQEQITWRDFQAESTLRVSVGFGATNPQKRIEKLNVGMQTIGNLFPELIQKADSAEIVKEVFGALGYKDGRRFFPALQDGEGENPEVQQLQAQLQKLQQMLQMKQVETEGKIKVETVKQQGANQREQMKIESVNQIESIKAKLAYIETQLKAETNKLARSELLLEQEALMHSQRVTEIRLLQEERGDLRDDIGGMSIEQTGMDDSKAGVIQRNNYGSVPFAEG